MELDTTSPLDTCLAWPVFTPFVEIDKYLGSLVNLDILGIVINKSDVRTVASHQGPAHVQDLVLVSQDLWNEFIITEGANALSTTSTFPIITALSVRSQKFRGTSLSAKAFANIVDEPIYPETAALQQWRDTNLDHLHQLVIERSYFRFSSNHSSVSHQTHSTIAKMIMTIDEGRYTVQGRVKLLHEAKTFYYIACANCSLQTTVAISQEYTCHHCKKKQAAKLEVVAFGDMAEMIVDFTTNEISMLNNLDEAIDVDKLNCTLQGREYIFQIRKKHYTNSKGDFHYYNLVGAAPVPDSLLNMDNQSLPTDVSNKRGSAISGKMKGPAVQSFECAELELLQCKSAKISSVELPNQAHLQPSPSQSMQTSSPNTKESIGTVSDDDALASSSST